MLSAHGGHFTDADDWYIIDAKKDSHVLVLYRGSNDAWDGYGGGTLYTRVSSSEGPITRSAFESLTRWRRVRVARGCNLV